MIAETSARANQQLKSIRICSACGSAVAASVHLRLLTARGDLRASRCLGLLVPQCHADAGGSEEKRVGGQSREQPSQCESAPPSAAAPRLASSALARMQQLAHSHNAHLFGQQAMHIAAVPETGTGQRSGQDRQRVEKGLHA